jgi:hypothetical protein
VGQRTIAPGGAGYPPRIVSVQAPTVDASTATPPRAPAFIMGLGLGGFIDGIVLHQILQWHHMLTDAGDHPSDSVAGLEANTRADGFFHLATWVLVATAMLLTLRAGQRRELAPPWRAPWGRHASNGRRDGPTDHSRYPIATAATGEATLRTVVSSAARQPPPPERATEHPGRATATSRYG